MHVLYTCYIYHLIPYIYFNSHPHSFFFLQNEQDVFVKHNAPIMVNSNEGKDHKDKYFDTSRKILSKEMTMCNMEALVSYPNK